MENNINDLIKEHYPLYAKYRLLHPDRFEFKLCDLPSQCHKCPINVVNCQRKLCILCYEHEIKLNLWKSL